MIKKVLNLRPILERKIGRTQPVFKFYNKDLYLFRSGKERPENNICFSTDVEMTKPEIKQVLTKLYGLDVKKVNTWNKQGKIMRKQATRGFLRKRDEKRVIVELNTVVPPELQSFK